MFFKKVISVTHSAFQATLTLELLWASRSLISQGFHKLFLHGLTLKRGPCTQKRMGTAPLEILVASSGWDRGSFFSHFPHWAPICRVCHKVHFQFQYLILHQRSVGLLPLRYCFLSKCEGLHCKWESWKNSMQASTKSTFYCLVPGLYLRFLKRKKKHHFITLKLCCFSF